MGFTGVPCPFPQATIQCNIEHGNNNLPVLYNLAHRQNLKCRVHQQPIHSVYLYIRSSEDAVGNSSQPIAILEELQRALTYTFHGMMDVHPETAGHNLITKTRETMSQTVRNGVIYGLTQGCARRHLQDGLHLSAQDLKFSFSSIQAGFDMLQRNHSSDRLLCAIVSRIESPPEIIDRIFCRNDAAAARFSHLIRPPGIEVSH